jgi:hypothetical protein
VSEFLVDAPLLACPDPSQWSREEFQEVFTEYLSKLTELAMLRTTCKSIRFWRDEDLPLVLNDQNCFPFRHSLNLAFQQLFDPLEFQLEDINVLATALIERSMRIEDAGDIKDIVVSNCSLAGDPAPNRSTVFLNHICRVVALALPILGNGKEFNTNTYIASCGASASSKELIANYTVDMVEKTDGAYLENFEPTTVQIGNYRGAITLFKDANLTDWWATSSEQSVIDACVIHECASQHDPLSNFKSIHDLFSVGLDFISSAQALGFMHDPRKINKLLRVCGDLASGRNLADSHSLRVGKGGNDAQRMRNDWRAWRHDIDDEFHLHYWRQSNRIELANVVVHNNFDITR